MRTAGHYSVFRCAASYQCAGLTEAAALVNMPSARASSGGGMGVEVEVEVARGTGFDGDARQTPPK